MGYDVDVGLGDRVKRHYRYVGPSEGLTFFFLLGYDVQYPCW